MLEGLLSKEECAGCRLCCSFESYDLLDTPTVTPDAAEKVLKEHLPEQEFLGNNGSYIMKMEPEPDSDIHYCPLLDHRKGCVMGDAKPFECRIWPLRVMKRGDSLVIALSPLCPVISRKPAELIRQKCEELADAIFAEAKACPALVKPYTPGCAVLCEENLHRKDK